MCCIFKKKANGKEKERTNTMKDIVKQYEEIVYLELKSSFRLSARLIRLTMLCHIPNEIVYFCICRDIFMLLKFKYQEDEDRLKVESNTEPTTTSMKKKQNKKIE